MIRLAISNIAWDVAEDNMVAELLREFGVDAVELAPTKYWPAPCQPSDAQLAECRREWRDRGIDIVSLQALLFGMPDLKVFGTAQQQQETQEYLARIFHIASKLGARTLVFGSPRNRDRGERSEAEAMEEALPFFRRLAESAERVDVILGLEPNPPHYNCNFLTNAETTRRFVEMIDHSHLRLHLDTGILTLNEELVEASLEACIPVLCSIHISEPFLGAVGGGKVDHRRIGQCLRKLNYCGPLSIEMRPQEDGDNLQAIRHALSVAREAYAA